MIQHDTVQAILSLKEKGIPTREISRILRVSRNTVRRVLPGEYQPSAQKASRYENLASLIQETLKRCKGNGLGRSFWIPMGTKSLTVGLPGW